MSPFAALYILNAIITACAIGALVCFFAGCVLGGYLHWTGNYEDHDHV